MVGNASLAITLAVPTGDSESCCWRRNGRRHIQFVRFNDVTKEAWTLVSRPLLSNYNIEEIPEIIGPRDNKMRT